MNRFVAFLMPISLPLRKMEGFDELWRTTHDLRVLPMIVADEYCEPLFGAETYQGPGQMLGWHKPILRNYWDDNQMDDDRIQYFPLGPRYEFPLHSINIIYNNGQLKKENDFLDPSSSSSASTSASSYTISKVNWTLVGSKLSHQRKYLINMMVSLDTDPSRILLQDRLTLASHNHLQSFNAKASKTGNELPSLAQMYIHNSVEWKSIIPTVIQEGESIPTQTYSNVLDESVFTLCPSGHNPETFRIFEACEAGSIPIVDFSSYANSCENPWSPFLKSQAPFIWLENWDDIVNVLLVLRSDPERVLAMQKEVITWYAKFMKSSMKTIEEAVRTHLAMWLVEHQNDRMRKLGGNDNEDASIAPSSSQQPHQQQLPLHELMKTYHRITSNKKNIDPKDQDRMDKFVQQQNHLIKSRWSLADYHKMASDKKLFRDRDCS